MKVLYLFILILMLTLRTKSENSSETASEKDYLNPSDNEDLTFLWKYLFGKLNGVVHATETISQNLVDVNKRLDDLTKRLVEQEANILKSFENSKTITKCKVYEESWSYILQRQDDSINFARSWQDYKNGFGNLEGSFFIGLERLHKLTSNGPPQELMIILKDFDNQTKHANYDAFRIGNEFEMYAITDLGNYTGNAGDGMRHHSGQPFSTFDRDNNKGSIRNCAQSFLGGWWYYDPCYYGHLAGPYRDANNSNTWGVSWDPWRRWNYSLQYAAMAIRSKKEQT